jgi:hypothetical protein
VADKTTKPRRVAAGAPRNLHALESRLDQLEGQVRTVIGGGQLAPASPSRVTRASQVLIVGGALLVLAAILLAIF